MTLPVTGIVLAGGQSRRMGRDKALLEMDGVTLLQRTVTTVSRVCQEVVLAAADRPPQHLPEPGLIWVPDEPGARGPLAGLASGLRAASFPTALVVACDMPFLNGRLLEHLAASVDGCDAVVPLVGDVSQPLHAAYSRDSLVTARALLRLGAWSMRDFLSRLWVRYLGEAHCRRYDPSGLSWFNLNTAGDLLFASERAGGRRTAAA